ncbi:MAG: hypothetical protein O2865_08045 [Planctomycetota bacterium]|nr:hypothetical protein [Planctomycetota bacterium]MDA1223101.1 hypothetical protein [Planctomycetota bacterium]
MIRWFLWFFLAPYLFLVEGLLAGTLPFRVDLAAAICLLAALFVRTSAVPGFLLCAALGRALLEDGDAAVHFLSMGIPVAVLLPARLAFVERSLAIQVLAAAFLALTMGPVAAFFAELSRQPVDVAAGSGWSAVMLTAFVAPLAAGVLWRLPPFGLFAEKRA